MPNIIQNLKYDTKFIVMPYQTNYMGTIFGGEFMAQMDMAAAGCVGRALHDSECDSAVTYKFTDGVFHAAAMCGDIIFLYAEILSAGRKSMVVHVKAYREKRSQKGTDFLAEVKFVFVTKKNNEFTNHDLIMPEETSNGSEQR